MLKTRNILVALTIKNKGNWENTYKDISDKVMVSEEEIQATLRLLKSCDIDFITILDEEYPSSLKRGYRPPFVLFYKGNIDLLNNKSTKLGVVGSRENTETDVHSARIINELPKDITLVVGGKSAIEQELDSTKHNTICVSPFSLDSAKGKELVSKNSLTITELPVGVETAVETFLLRNRIIASLSNKIFISTITKKSGTLTLVSQALELGKEILVAPVSLAQSETYCNNDLIYEGALCVSNVQQVQDSLE